MQSDGEPTPQGTCGVPVLPSPLKICGINEEQHPVSDFKFTDIWFAEAPSTDPCFQYPGLQVLTARGRDAGDGELWQTLPGGWFSQPGGAVRSWSNTDLPVLWQQNWKGKEKLAKFNLNASGMGGRSSRCGEVPVLTLPVFLGVVCKRGALLVVGQEKAEHDGFMKSANATLIYSSGKPSRVENLARTKRLDGTGKEPPERCSQGNRRHQLRQRLLPPL